KAASGSGSLSPVSSVRKVSGSSHSRIILAASGQERDNDHSLTSSYSSTCLGYILQVLQRYSSPSSSYRSQRFFSFRQLHLPSNCRNAPSSQSMDVISRFPKPPSTRLYFKRDSSSIMICHPAQQVSGQRSAIH